MGGEESAESLSGASSRGLTSQTLLPPSPHPPRPSASHHQPGRPDERLSGVKQRGPLTSSITPPQKILPPLTAPPVSTVGREREREREVMGLVVSQGDQRRKRLSCSSSSECCCFCPRCSGISLSLVGPSAREGRWHWARLDEAG